MEGAQGTSGNTRTLLLMSRRKTLSHQAGIEAEFHVEEEKNRRDEETGSHGEEFARSTATSGSRSIEGGGCSYSGKVQVAENTRAVKNTA